MDKLDQQQIRADQVWVSALKNETEALFRKIKNNNHFLAPPLHHRRCLCTNITFVIISFINGAISEGSPHTSEIPRSRATQWCDLNPLLVCSSYRTSSVCAPQSCEWIAAVMSDTPSSLKPPPTDVNRIVRLRKELGAEHVQRTPTPPSSREASHRPRIGGRTG